MPRVKVTDAKAKPYRWVVRAGVGETGIHVLVGETYDFGENLPVSSPSCVPRFQPMGCGPRLITCPHRKAGTDFCIFTCTAKSWFTERKKRISRVCLRSKSRRQSEVAATFPSTMHSTPSTIHSAAPLRGALHEETWQESFWWLGT